MSILSNVVSRFRKQSPKTAEQTLEKAKIVKTQLQIQKPDAGWLDAEDESKVGTYRQVQFYNTGHVGIAESYKVTK